MLLIVMYEMFSIDPHDWNFGTQMVVLFREDFETFRRWTDHGENTSLGVGLEFV